MDNDTFTEESQDLILRVNLQRNIKMSEPYKHVNPICQSSLSQKFQLSPSIFISYVSAISKCFLNY